MTFGYQNSSHRLVDAETQENALRLLGELVQRASVHPAVRTAALQIIQSAGCDSREDACEVQAIFDAVRYGDPSIPWLKTGFKYVADPRYADYFSSPVDTIAACQKGACGGDCDDHAALIAALLGSIGWKVGLRAYGVPGQRGYSHVYAVVAFPKKPKHLAGPSGPKLVWDKVLGLDTTVPSAKPGWEPPKGNVLTGWLD